MGFGFRAVGEVASGGILLVGEVRVEPVDIEGTEVVECPSESCSESEGNQPPLILSDGGQREDWGRPIPKPMGPFWPRCRYSAFVLPSVLLELQDQKDEVPEDKDEALEDDLEETEPVPDSKSHSSRSS